MEDAKRIDPREVRKEAQNNLTTAPLPSITAGVSWMFGVMSIPLLVLPPTSLVTGFLAIVTGHVSKAIIRRRPEVDGENTATSGLLMGYLCFLAALALLPSIRMQSAAVQGFVRSVRGVPAADYGTDFYNSERSFLDNGAATTGNNKIARELAEGISESLNEKRETVFRGRNPLPIRILCQSNDVGTLVLAIVPDFAEFDSDARDAMLNIAWKESQRLAFGKLTAGDDFAVAVRDRTRYHSMEFGRATRSPDRIAQPDSAFVDVTMLQRFFRSEPDLLEEENPEGEQINE